MEVVIILIGIISIVGVAIFNTSNANDKVDQNNSIVDQLKTLKAKYDESLLGSDKRAALTAGRAYYAFLREGKTLTVYDEQAIANDLCTMREAPLL